VKRLFLTVAIVTLLASCQAQQPEQPGLEQASPTAATPVEAPDEESAAQPPSQPPAPPLDGVFQTPLPDGVVVSQPHYARMDVSVLNKNGTAGRRTEFEYLEGDVGQAMQAFATSMTAAGFVSDDGPSSEEGLVRQVFSKPGYGTVFARAQQQAPSRNMHESARGFVVIAWPGKVAIK
jgi:hypothetical protein